MKTVQFHIVLLLVGLVALPGTVRAQANPDPLRFFAWPVQDLSGLVSGYSGTELLATAGTGVFLLGLSQFDGGLTDRAAGITEGAHVFVIQEFGNIDVVRPMAGAIFLGSLLSGNHRLQDAAFTSFEAVIYANWITNTLKIAVGRARPIRELGPDSFAPFSGDRSFPSGHATTAFAFLSPWFLYYPGPVTGGLLVLATATAFSRLATNEHWFSDVIGGSTIGFMTAYALTRRHMGSGRIQLRPIVGAAGPGLQLRF